ncbi:MAG: sel1 repeat family protein [Proteobacteria bacterium]|nr:sel1 repeat family protein [Pseudomonadota bacterium]
MRRSIVVGILIAALATPAHADFDGGWKAYLAGNYAASLREIRPLADAGVAEAQYALGIMYAQGHGVPRDLRQAVGWYTRAAQRGYSAAQFSLGFLYLYGAEDISADPAMAVRWLAAAAEQGNVTAQYLLGRLYRVGEGVVPDRGVAQRWTLAAAEHGLAAAEFEAGVLAYTDARDYTDLIEAYKWFDLAANQRYPGAAENRARVGERLNAEEIARAGALARGFRPKP